MIQAKVRELGHQIRRDYPGELVLLVVLKGAFIFAADLARAISGPVSIEFLRARSYGQSTESSGVVEITYSSERLELEQSIAGKDVLLVEDIVDTGLTCQALLEKIVEKKPRSVKLCALLHKPSRSRVPIAIDYLGFTIQDRFVVGYGLDFSERYRNLPDLRVLR